jgi:hypothetical protein
MHTLGRAARLGLALLATAAMTVGQVPLAVAAPVNIRTYPGPAYSSQVARPPTLAGSQSKLWFHADAWWALMFDPTARSVRVAELMPDHTWRPTPAVVNADALDSGDALPDGDDVHVVSRMFDGSLHYVRLRFDHATRAYSTTPSTLVTTRGPRAPATIAKDSTGRLWVAYATAAELAVTYSDDGGLTWAASNVLAEIGTGSSAEASALVSYDNRIGLLWSDQATGSFQFASHLDGDSVLSWSRETARAGPRAGDHISLRSVDGPTDTLVAAVKTSPGDLGELPEDVLIEVLVRTPEGTWSSVPVSTVADGLDDPVLQIDQVTGTLHLFASANDDVVAKQAPLNDIQFPPGPGRLFVLGSEGRLIQPTVAKAPVDTRSGQVVLVSDTGTLTYRHGEAPILSPAPVPDASDVTPPAAPTLLQGRASSHDTVDLSWAEGTDGDRWAAARNGVPVQGYVVLRDGVEIATVTSTFLHDEPRAGEDLSSEKDVRYEVVAVDSSGNRSPAAVIDVLLPRYRPEQDPTLVGLGLLGLAAVAGALAVRRAWLSQTMTLRPARALGRSTLRTGGPTTPRPS